jgi:hypothetical protein
VVDHERHRSLLGDAALAVLAGCIDMGDGKSLTELIGDLTATAPTRSPAPSPSA